LKFRKAILLYVRMSCTRLGQKLEAINAQFDELDGAAKVLAERLEEHRQLLAKQCDHDEVWSSLLEDRFTSFETNLFFSYVIETLRCCHSQVVRKLPDLVSGLPTLASVLRRKIKNRRVDVAWESTLEELGLGGRDAKALCAFFVARGYEAEYYQAGQREKYSEDVEMLIRKVVRNHVLRDSLLRAVQVVEKGKAGDISTNPEHASELSMRVRSKEN
uniref:Single-pass membrane protein with coiled-coil domains 1 n=1 Tax=Lepisosteus oculatus TaxID=7918 RepID=W5MGA9_LEPOC